MTTRIEQMTPAEDLIDALDELSLALSLAWYRWTHDDDGRRPSAGLPCSGDAVAGLMERVLGALDAYRCRTA